MKTTIIAIAISIFSLGARAAESRQNDPSNYHNSITTVAKVFGVSAAVAAEARARNLDELLSWSLMLMAGRCQCSVSGLMLRRKTMSWGEVAVSAGWEWGALMDELFARAKKAGIGLSAPSEEQLLRSSANDPESLPRQGDDDGGSGK